MKLPINFLLAILFNFLFQVSCFCAATNDQALEPEKNEKKVMEWDARLEYAKLLSNLKRYDESLAQYQRLLTEKPDSIPVQIGIANVLYYQGKRKEALALLEKIPADKIDSQGHILMGDIYVALKEYSKGESIYRTELKANPEDDLTRLKLAEMLSWQKKYEESVEFYKQILARHPNDIQVRRKYAYVLMWMGNDSKAAEELEKTLDNE